MIIANLGFLEKLFLFGTLITAIWLTVITIILWQFVNHYRKLTNNITKKDLKSILDEILAERKIQAKELKEIEAKLKDLNQEDQTHLQKIGFLRFNPFADTGGDQSFILAFLDNYNNGLVFSSLHSRGTTRLYVKKVVNGKGQDLELSNEESKVIKQAKKVK